MHPKGKEQFVDNVIGCADQPLDIIQAATQFFGKKKKKKMRAAVLTLQIFPKLKKALQAIQNPSIPFYQF